MKNAYKIIAKFKYDNNKYFITMVNNSKVVLVKYDENKKIRTDFTEEEYQLLNLVYNSLCVEKEKSVYIRNETLNSNIYKIYYDISSKNYFWKSINNTENESDNIILNFKYNNMTAIYFENDAEDKMAELIAELEKLTEETLSEFEKRINQNNEEDKEKNKPISGETVPSVQKSDKKTVQIEEEKENKPAQPIEKEDKSSKEKIFMWKSIFDYDEYKEEKAIQKSDEKNPEAVSKEKIQANQRENIDAITEEIEEILNEEKARANRSETTEEHLEENFNENEEDNSILSPAEKEQLKRTIRRAKEKIQEEKAKAFSSEKNEKEESNQGADEKKEENSNQGYFRKYIRFRKSLVPIFISASIVAMSYLPVLGAQGVKEEKISKQSIEQDEETKNLYNYEDLEIALQSNPTLTQEEKDFISKFKFVFDEDYQYIDFDMIRDRYETLQINYNNEYELEGQENYTLLAGTYDETKNSITIYGAKDFESADKTRLAHEYGHVLQKSSQRYIMELINEGYKREKLREMKDKGILEQELFEDNTNTYSNYGNGYSEHMYIYYILASLIDEEALKEYQYSCDDKVLVSQLYQLDKNGNPSEALAKAYQLLSSIDELKQDVNEQPKHKSEEQIEEECLKQLNYYFLQKYGINIEEDLNMVIHKMNYKNNVYRAIEKTILEEMGYGMENEYTIGPIKTIIPKSNFSNKYPNTVVAINSPEPSQIVITDNLCQKYRQYYREMNEPIYEDER